MGFFSTQGQVTLDVNSLMWLEVEFIRDLMAVLVTCKIEEDWIKSEVAIIWTTLSPLYGKIFHCSRASNSKKLFEIL